jgi:hypothetical protein
MKATFVFPDRCMIVSTFIPSQEQGMISINRSALSVFVGVAVAAGLANPRPVRADLQVTYSTSGTFDVNSVSGGPTITLSSGNLTIDLSYIGITETNLSVPTTTAPFGSFKITAETDGHANENTSGTFDLVLTQTAPASGSGTFTSEIAGSVKLGMSNAITVTFDSPPNPLTIGSISYTLPSSITLDSPARSVGASTTVALTASINGGVGAAGDPDPPDVAPEPSTLVSAATGVLMVLGYAWRRRPRAAT